MEYGGSNHQSCLIQFYYVISSGGWSEWSLWSTVCNQTCGGGKQNRTRECLDKDTIGCIGEEIERKDCNTQKCVGMINHFFVKLFKESLRIVIILTLLKVKIATKHLKSFKITYT